MKIAWSVKLPKGAKLKIKNEDGVKVGDLVYECHQSIIERLPLVGWQKLNSNERKAVLMEIIKKDLVVGQVIGKTGWFSKNVLKSPGTGKGLGVDEFGNIELEKAVEEKYLSPVESKKVRVDSTVAGQAKIVFELKGVEFECEGVNQYKSWGDFDGLVADDSSQIGGQQNRQIVVVKDNIEVAIKAEAVGASGLILVNIDKYKELEDSDIPVVLMKESDLDKLIKLTDDKIIRVWINAGANKVLAVLE